MKVGEAWPRPVIGSVTAVSTAPGVTTPTLGVRGSRPARALGVHVEGGVNDDRRSTSNPRKSSTCGATLPLMESDSPPRKKKNKKKPRNTYRAMEKSSKSRLNQGERATGRRKNSRASTSSRPGRDARARYLYWIGCGGLFDDRKQEDEPRGRQAPASAPARLSHPRPSELCQVTGARSGNEYIFQMLAMRTSSRSTASASRKLITSANMLQHVEERVPAARRATTRGGWCTTRSAEPARVRTAGSRWRRRLDERVTYHGQCYLGTGHNDVYLAPRKRHRQPRRITPLVEMRDNGNQACALRRRRRAHVEGGADRQEGNSSRTEEALGTGAKPSRVACQFCYVMGRRVKEKGRDDDVKGQDHRRDSDRGDTRRRGARRAAAHNGVPNPDLVVEEGRWRGSRCLVGWAEAAGRTRRWWQWTRRPRRSWDVPR